MSLLTATACGRGRLAQSPIPREQPHLGRLRRAGLDGSCWRGRSQVPGAGGAGAPQAEPARGDGTDSLCTTPLSE